MKSIILIIATFLVNQPVHSQNQYPNELKQYQLYQKYCSKIQPMRTCFYELKDLLGKPQSNFNNTLHYEKDGWNISVRFTNEPKRITKYVNINLVTSIEFSPNTRISLSDNDFPTEFQRTEGGGVDARWKVYYDIHGLEYLVYNSNPPYGKEQKGDLFKVIYSIPLYSQLLYKQREIDKLKKEIKNSK
jgi:hypothetical protein